MEIRGTLKISLEILRKGGGGLSATCNNEFRFHAGDLRGPNTFKEVNRLIGKKNPLPVVVRQQCRTNNNGRQSGNLC